MTDLLPVSHTIVVLAPDWSPLAFLRQSEVFSGTYTRNINDVGSCALQLTPDLPRWYFDNDCVIQIYRNGVLANDTMYFVKKPSLARGSDGKWSWTVTGKDLNEMLNWRIVSQKATSAGASKNIALDNMMKAIVSENATSSASDYFGAAAERAFSNFVIAPNQTLAPISHETFPHKPLLNVMQDLAKASFQNGIYLAFDMLWNGTQIEFRTFIGQRGLDRRGDQPNAVLLTTELGNIGATERIFDYSDEVSFAYVGGPGTNLTRQFEYVQALEREAGKRYGRKEFFHRFQQQTATSAEMIASGLLALNEHAARFAFNGELLGRPHSQYGEDYFWGDTLSVVLNSRVGLEDSPVGGEVESFDCRFETAKVNFNGQGGEQVLATLTSLSQVSAEQLAVSDRNVLGSIMQILKQLIRANQTVSASE